MRIMSWTITWIVRDRPGPRRWMYVHFCATDVRYHRISVSGVTNVLSSLSALRPNAYALRASRRRSASVNRRRRPPSRSFSDPIFFLEVIDHLELPTIDPAGKQRQEEFQRLDGAKHCQRYSGLQHIERGSSSTCSGRWNNWTLRHGTAAPSVSDRTPTGDFPQHEWERLTAI